MNVAITRTVTSEQRELEKKLRELNKLEAKLAQAELDLATMRAELRVIDLMYIRRVGARLAQMDLIEARIAEILGRLNPDDQARQTQAKEARRHAEETRKKAKSAQAAPEKNTQFKPSERLRALYREAAKKTHPDLANNGTDREARNQWMAEINLAYQTGDEERLEALIRDWQASPESVQGDSTSAVLERTIRKIAQVLERLEGIQSDREKLKRSFAYSLRNQMRKAEKEGRDLLEEMSQKIEKQIARKQSLLDDLLKNSPPMWKIEW